MRARLVALTVVVSLLAALAGPALAAGGRLQVGVTGAGGAPLAGARVELIAANAGTVATGRTGPSGRVALDAPAGDSFWVRVWAPGHATGEQPWVPGADGPAVALDLVPLTGALTGLVLDHQGLPVPGARVTAWRRGWGLQAEATAAPDGSYALRGLPVPAAYQVQAEAPGFRALAVPAPGVAPDQEQRLDLSLAPATATVAGELVDARSGAPLAGARVELLRHGWGILAAARTDAAGAFSLEAPPAEGAEYTLLAWAPDHAAVASAPFALPPGARQDFSGAARLAAAPLWGSVWGLVLDDGGAGMAGVAVELQLQGAGTVARATTGPDGLFAFDRAPAGTYRVRAFPGTGWAPSDSAWVALPPGGARTADVLAVRYVKKNHGQGYLAGVVTDGAGAPLAGARVTALRGDEKAAAATTDARGRYRLPVDGNRPGAGATGGQGYVLRVEREGFLPSDQPLTASAPSLDVLPNRVTQADFSLRPATGAAAGYVLDDRGRPVPGAAVTLYRDGDGPVAAAVTGPGGSYRFPAQAAVPGVRFWVGATAEGFVAAADRPADPGQVPGAVLPATLRLRPAAARLQGRVADPRGRPEAGAAVTILHPASGRTWTAQADQGGWYSQDGLPAGPADAYLVRAATPGGRAAAADEGAVALAGLRARTVNVAPAPAGSVAGTVVGPDGGPVAGAAVELWREGAAEPVQRTHSGADGSYRFAGLGAGERHAVSAWQAGYVLSAQAPGDATLTPLFTAQAGQAVRADVALGAAP